MKALVIGRSLAAAVLAGVLISPSGAAAVTGPQSRTTPPSIDQEIGEQGSHGFYVTVKVHDRHRLELTATKYARSLAIESVNYKMPYRSKVSADEIKARFGKLGRVDMRFVPEKVKHPELPGSSCKGGEVTEEEGFWVGLLAFHGEEGFTRVRVHSALGTVVKVPPLRCRPEKPPNLKKLKRALEALEKAQGESKEEEAEEEIEEVEPPPFVIVAALRHPHVRFIASRESFVEGKRKASESDLIVLATRKRGRIEETGGVIDAFAPGSYVRPTNSLEPEVETVLKPPEPFSGSAVYRDPPDGRPTWTGDLKVELPGFGEIRLAGGGTHAVECESLLEPKCGRGLPDRASSLVRRLARR